MYNNNKIVQYHVQESEKYKKCFLMQPTVPLIK